MMAQNEKSHQSKDRQKSQISVPNFMAIHPTEHECLYKILHQSIL